MLVFWRFSCAFNIYLLLSSKYSVKCCKYVTPCQWERPCHLPVHVPGHWPGHLMLSHVRQNLAAGMKSSTQVEFLTHFNLEHLEDKHHFSISIEKITRVQKASGKMQQLLLHFTLLLARCDTCEYCAVSSTSKAPCQGKPASLWPAWHYHQRKAREYRCHLPVSKQS